MDERNHSDHATNVTAADGNVTAVSDILERLHDILDGPVPMYVSRQDIRDVINEIERLHQKEHDILAGIQLVVKGSNAGRDKEIERLNAELEGVSAALNNAKDLINSFTDVASRLAALVLQIPCKCEGTNDGTCPMCSAYMDWERVIKHVG